MIEYRIKATESNIQLLGIFAEAVGIIARTTVKIDEKIGEIAVSILEV